MKQLYLLFLLISSIAHAQQTEGVVHYTSTTQIEVNEETQLKLKSLGIEMADKKVDYMQLRFTNKESSYTPNMSKEEKPLITTKNHGRVQMTTIGNKTQSNYYRNLINKEKIHFLDFMSREFRIRGKEQSIAWKITGKQSQLGAYQAMQASAIIENDTISAWFTPQIPVSTGPGKYAHLPGLILRVDVNHGKQIIEATTIELRNLTAEEQIETPSKGKQITQEEFDKLKEEKLKEMEELYGSKSTFSIQVQ